MTHPPHLPPKACSIELHHKFQSLRWLLFFVCLMFLVGVSSTLVTVAWIAPTYVPGGATYTIEVNPHEDQSKNLDPLFVRQVSKRLVSIYDTRKKTGDGLYTKDATVASGVFFTSDGWLAAYYPSFYSGLERHWEIIDYRGLAYKVEEVIVDKASKLVYLKIEGDGFPVIDFPDWSLVDSNMFVWVVNGNEWQAELLGESVKVEDAKSYPIWLPAYQYRLNTNDQRGAVVLNESGLPVGFVDEDENVILAFFLEQQYPTVLKNETVEYMSVPWKGSMIHKILMDDVWVDRVGFFVANTNTKATSSTVGVGDVVVRIEGSELDEYRLAEQIFLAPNPFHVIVLRETQEIDILVDKEPVILTY